MRNVFLLLAAGTALVLTGCHSYGQPVITTIRDKAGVEQDVVWLVDGNNTVVRCTLEEGKPVCRDANHKWF